MLRWLQAASSATLLMAASTGLADAACQIKDFADLPVTVLHNRFIVDAAIDGKPVKLILDSGAFGTTLFGAAAERLGLSFRNNGQAVVSGIGGQARAAVRHVGEFRFGRYIRNNTLIVVAPTARLEPGVDGLLGRDEYGNFDLEFDIAHRTIRFLRADGCSDAQMPYWATTAYSEVPLIVLPQDTSAEFRTTLGLDGRPIEVTVDSGTPITTVSLSAANSAGLHQAELKAIGQVGGVGLYRVTDYVGNFRTVSIGGETVHNVDLEVADLFHYTPVLKTGDLVATEDEAQAQGLLGADFLMSHRVLLSHSHRMMYFTYEGGMVFGPNAGPPASVPPAATPSPEAAPKP